MNICFDFDGTIADSFPVYLEFAYKYAASKHLDPVSVSEARNLGLTGLINHYRLSKFELIRILLWGQKSIRDRITEIKPFPGLPKILSQISKNHTLCLISSSPKPNIDLFLSHNQLSHLFAFVDTSPDLFGKDKKIKKYHPDFYTGDETRDIVAARKSGCKSIAVTWGFESAKLLSKSHPDYLVNEPSALLDIFA